MLGLILYIVFSGRTQTVKKATAYQSSYKELEQSNPVIYMMSSVFPFDLFPDKYVVQDKTISIVRKRFFLSAWSETIPIKDIGSVRIYTGPFFATVILIKKILPPISIELRTLWKKDAIKAKEILDALILKENKLITLPKGISQKEKKRILIDIGTEEEVEKEII